MYHTGKIGRQKGKKQKRDRKESDFIRLENRNGREANSLSTDHRCVLEHLLAIHRELSSSTAAAFLFSIC